VAEQRSLVAPQTVQAPPLTPQVLTEAARQLLAAQQPPGQEKASQTQVPLAQRCP
jgi:hypothetical protein